MKIAIDKELLVVPVALHATMYRLIKARERGLRARSNRLGVADGNADSTSSRRPRRRT